MLMLCLSEFRSLVVGCACSRMLLFQSNFLKLSVQRQHFSMASFQVSLLTDNIQLILDALRSSTVVEMQVSSRMKSWVICSSLIDQ